MLRIGVDVGGTNTDAVVMDGARVRAWAKVTTTPDVTEGIVAVTRRALVDCGVAPSAVRAVMVGTTHFTNALVERRGLSPTAVVRLGLPATDDPLAAILAVAGGRVLLRGKIVDVERRTTAGFARGRVAVAGTGADEGRTLRVDFQNENLVAELADLSRAPGLARDREPGRASPEWMVVASVPDLVCIVSSEDGEPIGTELLRYGYRVAVLVLPAPPELRTPEALAVVGPRAFGYDVDYRPVR